jgi:ribosome biogenesis GTPase
VFNKTDLLDDPSEFDPLLEVFGRVGYETVKTSAETGAGLHELQAFLQGNVAIIVGQSGVGKSSLINILVGDDRQRTSEISDKTGEGRHTTVNSVMLELPAGGCVIDSPGVRDFAPALQSATDVERGFREIHDAGHDCHFNNCRHLREPNCAVKDRVAAGSIDERRYDSYKRMLKLTESLKKSP